MLLFLGFLKFSLFCSVYLTRFFFKITIGNFGVQNWKNIRKFPTGTGAEFWPQISPPPQKKTTLKWQTTSNHKWMFFDISVFLFILTLLDWPSEDTSCDFCLSSSFKSIQNLCQQSTVLYTVRNFNLILWNPFLPLIQPRVREGGCWSRTVQTNYGKSTSKKLPKYRLLNPTTFPPTLAIKITIYTPPPSKDLCLSFFIRYCWL